MTKRLWELWFSALASNPSLKSGRFWGKERERTKKANDILAWSGDLLVSALNALNLYLRVGKRHGSRIQGLKSKPPDPPIMISSIQFPMEQIANSSIVTLP